MTQAQGDSVIAELDAIGHLVAQAVNLLTVAAIFLAVLVFFAASRRWW